MTTRAFSHPHFEKKVSLAQHGKEVHLIFTAESKQQADSAFDELLRQLKSGSLSITLMGTPTSIRES